MISTKKNLLLFCISLLACIQLDGQLELEPCILHGEIATLCDDACIVCNIVGFKGETDDNTFGQVPEGFCTSEVNNPQWIAFQAASSDLVIKLGVEDCNLNMGLEIGIFQTEDCNTFTLVSECRGDLTEFVVMGELGVIPVIEDLVVGEYYFIVIDGVNGDQCDWKLFMEVGDTEIPELTESGDISGNIQVCPGISSFYSVPENLGANNYQWTLNGAIISEGDPFVDIDWTEEGEYELCVIASNDCYEAPPSCVPIDSGNFPPQVFSPTICEGESFLFNDTQLTVAQTYEFNYLSSNGCDSTIFINLEVVEIMETMVEAQICQGDSLYIGPTAFFSAGLFEENLLSVFGCDSLVSLELEIINCELDGSVEVVSPICYGSTDGLIEVFMETGTLPIAFQWKKLDNSLSGNGSINSLNETILIENLPYGTYLITLSDIVGNDLVIIQEIVQSTQLSAEWLLSDFNGTGVSCAESSDGTLEVLVAGGSGTYSYEWSNGAGASFITNLSGGDYEVTVTDDLGCSLISQNTLSSPDPLNFNVLFTNTTCESSTNGRIQVLNATGGNSPYQYQIDNSGFQSTNDFQGLESGVYTISIRDANGCEIDTTASIFSPIIPMIDAGADVSIFLGESVTIDLVSNVGLDQITWSPSEGLSCTDCPNPSAQPYTNTTYSVTVSSIDGCVASDSIRFEVETQRRVYVPNVFSPNDDGLNDIVTVLGGAEIVSIRDFKIFSRWGEMVFEAENFEANGDIGWDGFFRDRAAISGVYVWFAEVEFLDGQSELFKGDVVLIR